MQTTASQMAIKQLLLGPSDSWHPVGSLIPNSCFNIDRDFPGYGIRKTRIQHLWWNIPS